MKKMLLVIAAYRDVVSRIVNARYVLLYTPELSRDAGMEVVGLDGALFNRGLDLYARRPDKSWSLTDCISFVVMADRSSTEALTGDHDFERTGFRALLT
jgi:hypothetical protein